ncbi:helix-turn-helix domain-containing protein [Flavobacterium sp. W1B]|uniref:helix-turn-helix domain-containing protein n=1 Tax=Flavobacterium sp. W1B TaxID=3394146 RepID=UPI0039BC6C45
MLKKLYYEGLYGNDSIEFVKGLINVYPFGVIGKQFDGEVKPHIHNNLFQIFIIENGSTELIFNENQYALSGPCFITVPKNTEHGFKHKTDMNGWIITLSDKVLENMLYREADVIFEMDAIHITAINSGDETLTEVYQTMQKCVAEYQNNLPGKLLMLQNLVGQIIVQLYRLPSESRKIITSSDNSGKIYFRRFQQLIKVSNSFKITVEKYASELGISAGHLNRICHTIAAKSPKDIIIDFFITEAQLALTNPDNSITEISYNLSFEDPGYFTRLFKKRTGLTPKAFREKIGVKIH